MSDIVDLYKTINNEIFDEEDYHGRKIKASYPNFTNAKLKNLDNNVYNYRIENNNITPWLTWLNKGIIKYFATTNKNNRQRIKPNDIIIFHNKIKVKTKVIEIKYYPTFVAAYRELGTKLIPLSNITYVDVQNIYLRYFSSYDTEKYGVLVLKLKLLKN